MNGTTESITKGLLTIDETVYRLSDFSEMGHLTDVYYLGRNEFRLVFSSDPPTESIRTWYPSWEDQTIFRRTKGD